MGFKERFGCILSRMKGCCRLLALCLALCLVAGCASATEADPVVVRVGTVEYRLSEVQQYWNNLATLYTGAGGTISENEIAQYEQSIIESYVSMDVIQNKFVEFGLEARLYPKALDDSANAYYTNTQESYAQQVMSQYGVPEEEAMQHALTFMALDGYTMDIARE